MITKGVYLGNY